MVGCPSLSRDRVAPALVRTLTLFLPGAGSMEVGLCLLSLVWSPWLLVVLGDPVSLSWGGGGAGAKVGVAALVSLALEGGGGVLEVPLSLVGGGGARPVVVLLELPCPLQWLPVPGVHPILLASCLFPL